MDRGSAARRAEAHRRRNGRCRAARSRARPARGHADGRARAAELRRAGGNHAPSAVALADIPGNYLQWIREAGARYALDWSIVAGIYSIETDFGRLNAPGVQVGENFAGAGGPGQFLAATWERYGVDGDGDGVKDRYDPVDAIPGTANLLRQNGAPGDYGARDLRLQPRQLVRRRGAHARGPLPRRRRGQTETRCRS